jgi:hypothetical protein
MPDLVKVPLKLCPLLSLERILPNLCYALKVSDGFSSAFPPDSL